jgi:hypothetical protein
MLGTGIGLALYWLLYARARFTGPVPADETALRQQEPVP